MVTMTIMITMRDCLSQVAFFREHGISAAKYCTLALTPLCESLAPVACGREFHDAMRSPIASLNLHAALFMSSPAARMPLQPAHLSFHISCFPPPSGGPHLLSPATPQTLRMLESHPTSFTLSLEDNIKPTLSFLTCELDLPNAAVEVERNPAILGTNLNFNLRPTVAFLRAAGYDLQSRLRARHLTASLSSRIMPRWSCLLTIDPSPLSKISPPSPVLHSAPCSLPPLLFMFFFCLFNSLLLHSQCCSLLCPWCSPGSLRSFLYHRFGLQSFPSALFAWPEPLNRKSRSWLSPFSSHNFHLFFFHHPGSTSSRLGSMEHQPSAP